jgi:hypothetical protein
MKNWKKSEPDVDKQIPQLVGFMVRLETHWISGISSDQLPWKSYQWSIPRKLKMPSSELAGIQENYAAGSTQPDTQVGKVWWDGGN